MARYQSRLEQGSMVTRKQAKRVLFVHNLLLQCAPSNQGLASLYMALDDQHRWVDGWARAWAPKRRNALRCWHRTEPRPVQGAACCQYGCKLHVAGSVTGGATHVLPVGNLPPVVNVHGTLVLVLQVVSMLPVLTNQAE